VFWFGTTITVAVVVSAVPPASLSIPGAAPPSSSVTPNQGSAPITNELLAGCATMVAVLPAATVASTVDEVDAAAPLIDTEHQPWKFMTVRLVLPPELSAAASLASASASPSSPASTVPEPLPDAPDPAPEAPLVAPDALASVPPADVLPLALPEALPLLASAVEPDDEPGLLLLELQPMPTAHTSDKGTRS
jgi:hypothetical protein